MRKWEALHDSSLSGCKGQHALNRGTASKKKPIAVTMGSLLLILIYNWQLKQAKKQDNRCVQLTFPRFWFEHFIIVGTST